MKQKFYTCEHCGNIIVMVRDCGVPVACCGEQMQEIQPGTAEGAGEKHIPVYEVNGRTVTVRVGAVEHPMNQEHYIQWICLETERGVQYRELRSEDRPIAAFTLWEGDKVAGVYAFCNLHHLWKGSEK